MKRLQNSAAQIQGSLDIACMQIEFAAVVGVLDWMAIKINVRGMSALKPNKPRSHTLGAEMPQTPGKTQPMPSQSLLVLTNFIDTEL